MQIRLAFIVFCFQLLSLSPISAQVKFTEITSQADWENAFATAKEEGKHIFVDVHAQWCMPCHQMDKETFPKPAVGDYFNEKYVSLKVDGETDFGQIFAVKQAIQAYPTLLFFDQEKTLISKSEGYLNADQFLEKGKSIPRLESRFAVLSKGHEIGSLSSEEKLEYADLLKVRGHSEAASAIVSKYLDDLPVNDLLPYREWELIKANVTDFRQTVFQKVIDNKALFDKWRGQEEVRLFIGTVLENGLVTVPMMGTESDMKNLLASTLPHLDDEQNRVDLKKVELEAWLDFYQANEEWEKYIAAVEAYPKENETNDFFYFEMAQNALGNEIPELMSAALTWAEKSYSLNPDLQNSALFTYALFMNGKNEEAEKMLQKMETEHAEDENALELIGSFREEFSDKND